MARLYVDPFHPCPICKRLTDNKAACDDCLDFMNFMLNCYEEREGELGYKRRLPPPQVKPPDPS